MEQIIFDKSKPDGTYRKYISKNKIMKLFKLNNSNFDLNLKKTYLYYLDENISEINSPLNLMKRLQFFIFLIRISFPISDKIFLFLRLQDFFVLIFIFINIFFLQKKEIKFLLIIFLILCATNLIGYIYF